MLWWKNYRAKRAVWKKLKNSNEYFIAFKIAGDKYEVSHSAKLLDIMSVVGDMVVEENKGNVVFVDYNQAGDA